MTRKRALRILEALKGHYGPVDTDLRFTSLYQLMIAVVLSAQTTDRQVNSVTPELFRRYPDFRSLAAAPADEVELIIRSTGFYRNKTRSIIALAGSIMARGGTVPDSREELMELPGIGRKSANVILSVGLGVPALAVDTHILRLANRIGFASTESPDRAEEALTSVLPPGEWTAAHLLLIRHGRTLCPARNPRCGECPVSGLCDFAGSGR